MIGILKDIRVLDLGRYISAPSCAQILADMGAEVIKVEKQGRGDEGRSCGPWKNGSSLYFSAYNRNKRSVEIDFRSEDGQKILRGLIEKSDVLIENFRTGTMANMGLSYEEIKKINPRMIMASITGFGQFGPECKRPAYDQVISYRTHLYSKIGEGKFNIGPDLMSDTVAGINAALAIVLALYDREKTGEGQWIDLCMLSSSVYCQPIALADYAMNGEQEEEYFIDAPNGVFKTKDGYVTLTAGPQPMFMRVREVVPSEIIKDEKYINVENRIKDNDLLRAEITKWTMSLTSKEVDQVFFEHGLTGGVINTWEGVLEDTHLRAREHFIDLPVKNAGTVPYSKFPAVFSGHEYKKDTPVPELGADNKSVFKEILGMSDEEIEKLPF